MSSGNWIENALPVLSPWAYEDHKRFEKILILPRISLVHGNLARTKNGPFLFQKRLCHQNHPKFRRWIFRRLFVWQELSLCQCIHHIDLQRLLFGLKKVPRKISSEVFSFQKNEKIILNGFSGRNFWRIIPTLNDVSLRIENRYYMGIEHIIKLSINIIFRCWLSNLYKQ